MRDVSGISSDAIECVANVSGRGLAPGCSAVPDTRNDPQPACCSSAKVAPSLPPSILVGFGKGRMESCRARCLAFESSQGGVGRSGSFGKETVGLHHFKAAANRPALTRFFQILERVRRMSTPHPPKGTPAPDLRRQAGAWQRQCVHLIAPKGHVLPFRRYMAEPSGPTTPALTERTVTPQPAPFRVRPHGQSASRTWTRSRPRAT